MNRKRVSKVIDKTKILEASDKRPNSLLSGNKVTGHSLNFPIHGTCRPSKVCIETCYYAAGATSWTASLRKQIWLFDYCSTSPIEFAKEIVAEYKKLNLDYLRWNGGGDLFPASAEALNYIGENHPEMTIWIVTRIPEMAALIGDYPNLHLHFSLDAHSLERREKALELVTRPIFFSYQCMKEEKPDVEFLTKNHGVSLFFFDNYKITDPIYQEKFSEFLCTLNLDRTNNGDITGSCSDCRMCFNGHWLEGK